MLCPPVGCLHLISRLTAFGRLLPVVRGSKRPEAVTAHHIPGLKAWIAELTVHDAVQQHVINH